MKTPLRALIIEDSEDDAQLVVRDLKRAGYDTQYERVDTAAAVQENLDNATWDIILSDYSMPQFSGIEALKLVRSQDTDTPFIFVSGTIGEDVAVEAMRAGAQDYVIKGNLRRLAPAIERELREAAVRRARKVSEARFRRVVECDMMGIFFWHTDGRITEANDEFLRIIGWDRTAFTNEEIGHRGLTPSGYIEADAHAMAEFLADGSCTPYEKEYVRKDGSRIPVLVGGARLDANGSLVSFVLDMTAQRRAAQALQERERQQAAVARLGQLAIETPDLALLLDAAAESIACTLNVPFSGILEVQPDGRVMVLSAGRGWSDGSVGHAALFIDDQSRSGYAIGHGVAVTVENARTDGRFPEPEFIQRHGIVSGVSVIIPASGRNFGVISAEDITPHVFSQDDIHFLQAVAHILGTTLDRGQVEVALRQSQRLESVGRLAGGVAHDFNNLLTVIMSHTEFLLEGLTPGEQMHGDAMEIQNASRRATGLTRQLLTFSRQQRLEPKILNLNTSVVEMQKMLVRLIGADIILQVVQEPALRQVEADPGQVEQVVMNLVVNARDAMPNGGTLAITTANLDITLTGASLYDGAVPGRYVTLRVSDTGIGMSAETQSRIFEPFFTTKGPEKGTGLGLATVYGIVKQSRGSVRVTSAPGRGSTFEVLLPAASHDR